MTGPVVLVVAADGRVAAAARGFLVPAGITVLAIDPARAGGAVDTVREPLAELPGETVGAAPVCALVDWNLVLPGGGHLGLALRDLRPGLRLIALVDAGVPRALPEGWDAMVHLPLVRDALMQAVQAG